LSEKTHGSTAFCSFTEHRGYLYGTYFTGKYSPRLTVRETQDAIKYIRDTFQKELGREMNLERTSAPLFVEQSSGLNDNLNGMERPVQFDIASIPGETV